MILGNQSVITSYLGGRGLSGANIPFWRKPSVLMSFYSQYSVENNFKKSSFPNGYTPPYTWVLAPTAGGMSVVLVTGTGTIVGTIAGAKSMVAPLTAGGIISSATMGLIKNMVAAITAGGVISNASLLSAAQMTADLLAGGDLVGAIEALGHLTADINAGASLTAVNYAIAHMTADLVPYTALSPESLASAVWNKLASEVNNSGTTGEKLNAAGTAGDPWTTDLSGYNTAGTAGKKLKELKNASLLIDGEVIV